MTQNKQQNQKGGFVYSRRKISASNTPLRKPLSRKTPSNKTPTLNITKTISKLFPKKTRRTQKKRGGGILNP